MSRPTAGPARLAELFGVDLCSLALVRIGTGLVLLADLALRSPDLRAHYTDFGILPSEALPGHGWLAVYTLHAVASPSALAVGALFALAAAVALALVLGWRTRTATLLSWVLVSSLQYRQPALCHGGDVMLRMLLFWGLFLPLGARFSLDARRDPGRVPRPDLHVSVASAALLLQVSLVYAFTVLNRDGPTWWNGTALHAALHYDQFATRVGIWLRQLEALLPPLTHVAIGFEALGPLLAFVPVATGPLRTLAVGLFLGFHAVLALLFDLGLFPAVFAVAWLAFLPPWFWRRTERVRRGSYEGSVASAPERSGRSPWRGAHGVSDALAALAFALVLASNLASVRMDPWVFLHTPPEPWNLPARILRLDQRWALFAPDPPVHDGWYVWKGILANGGEVDLLRPGAPPGFEKPAVVSEALDIRWREYLLNLALDARDPRWPWIGAWLCRSWDERHAGAGRLERIYVYYVQERTTPEGPRREGILTLLAQECVERGPA